MIGQVLLVTVLVCIGAYAASQYRGSPAVSAAMTLIVICGVTVVVAPSLATELARAMGIGRGADLIMYVFILAMLGALLNIHLKLRSNLALMTELARALALQSASSPKNEG
jgi:small membrane protein